MYILIVTQLRYIVIIILYLILGMDVIMQFFVVTFSMIKITNK